MAEVEVVDRVRGRSGELVLRRRGAVFEVIANGTFLMDSSDGRSERLLADAALARHQAGPTAATVLVGGLGMGFTLQAVLAHPVERVLLVEWEPALVGWHAGPLAACSAGALSDPRVEVLTQDLVEVVQSSVEQFDVVALDVDNGPEWTVTGSNRWLYGDAGTAAVRERLAHGGVLAVWSSGPSRAYRARLEEAFTDVIEHHVAVARGEPDVVWVARR